MSQGDILRSMAKGEMSYEEGFRALLALPGLTAAGAYDLSRRPLDALRDHCAGVAIARDRLEELSESLLLWGEECRGVARGPVRQSSETVAPK